MSLVKLDITDGVARLTLNWPDKRNALNAELIDALTDALKTAEVEARVVTLSGEGPAFCAGADLKSVGAMTTEAQFRAHADRLGGLFATLADLSIPSICAVNGPALGAGCGIVCSATLAIAGPAAHFGFPELSKGVLPALVVPPLVNVIGERRALHVLCTEIPFDAAEAFDLGIVTQLSDTPEETAAALARHLASLPPDRLARIRQLIRTAATEPTAEARRQATEANVADRLAGK
ncbi:MAG: enoyl-CoA hydratase/isomerase family protein [Roseovarius sp.]|uniref:enoyl-CoA hydratase/isomerase family protein n=1 Tax=Roseovarius sp. TaxID=1486281 RepID=UPI0032EB0FE9